MPRKSFRNIQDGLTPYLKTGACAATLVMAGAGDQLQGCLLYIDADQITADLGGDPLIGGKAALKKIRKCLRKRVAFLQETTLSGYKTNATAKKSLEQGYTVHLIYIGLDTVEESLRRIENRVREGGHNIPQEYVIRRFQNRWDAVSKILPYCVVAEFYDNDEDFVKVAEYRNGKLFRIGNLSCSWIEELDAYIRTSIHGDFWQMTNTSFRL